MRGIHRPILCTIVVLMIIALGLSDASAIPSDFQWGIKVGDRISYRYEGVCYEDVSVNGSWEYGLVHFDEEMYIEIDDITGIPYPVSPKTPGVSPFWANGTAFSDYEPEPPFHIAMFDVLGPFALTLGNWTFLEEFTLDVIDSSFHEIYNNRVGWVNETSTKWNFTLVYYQYWNSSLITPYCVSIKQYSKSDGILDYAIFDSYADWQSPFTLEISRIQNESNMVSLTVVAFGGSVIILTLVVIWKRKR
ncbi:MAG: hypothetical protein ACFFBL_02930 [Promethearchaeota archaeon]